MLDPVERCEYCRRRSEYCSGYCPSVARGINYCHNLFLSPDQRLYIVNNMYRPTCTHVSQCIETVFELPLLPNFTAIETFIHKWGTLRIVDWIFLTGAPVWRSLGEYVTLGNIFYNPHSKQLAEVSRRETDEHPLPNTRAVTVFF
jgi:hypothetical protein